MRNQKQCKPGNELCASMRARMEVGGFESGMLTGGVCVSVPLLASRLRMLLSDICRRAAMGGTRDSVAGSRVTSAFMSLSSSSSWFNTGSASDRHIKKKSSSGLYQRLEASLTERLTRYLRRW